MSYSIEGIIIKLYDKQVFKETFEKREFVIRTKDDYPQEIRFEAIQKMVPLLDEYSEGDEVFLDFNIKGKENKGTYWNNLQIWRVRKTKDVPVENKQESKTKGKKVVKKEKSVEPAFQNPTKDEDMPF